VARQVLADGILAAGDRTYSKRLACWDVPNAASPVNSRGMAMEAVTVCASGTPPPSVLALCVPSSI